MSDIYALTGRVTAQHTIRGITRDGWVIERTTTYIDIGRPAPIDASDPDAALAPEQVDGLGGARFAKRTKTQALFEQVSDALQDGPMTALEIAAALGVSPFRVKALVRYHAHEFDIVSRGPYGCRYRVRVEG